MQYLEFFHGVSNDVAKREVHELRMKAAKVCRRGRRRRREVDNRKRREKRAPSMIRNDVAEREVHELRAKVCRRGRIEKKNEYCAISIHS